MRSSTATARCLFESTRGGGYPTLAEARYPWRKAAATVGGIVDGVRLHDLRHTCALIAISAVANVNVVQKVLGHKMAICERLGLWRLVAEDRE